MLHIVIIPSVAQYGWTRVRRGSGFLRRDRNFTPAEQFADFNAGITQDEQRVAKNRFDSTVKNRPNLYRFEINIDPSV